MNKKELLEDLDDRISAAAITGLWPDDFKLRAINQAGQRVCDFKPWEWLKRAVYTTTRDEKEYYDYPEDVPQLDGESFKLNSIYNIVIEEEEYYGDDGRMRKKWDDFQRNKNLEKEELIFTNHNKWFFLHPVPEDGKEMVLYGLLRWRDLENDNDEPISPVEYDEAIVRIALATCLRKAKKHDEARAEVAEVLSPEGGILMTLYTQEMDEGPRGYSGKFNHIRYA